MQPVWGVGYAPATTLPSSDSLPRVHDIGADGAAMGYRPVSPALPHCRDMRRPHPRCLCQHVGLRGHGVRLWRLPWASGLVLPITRGEHEASAEEIKMRAATHLAFQDLQAHVQGVRLTHTIFAWEEGSAVLQMKCIDFITTFIKISFRIKPSSHVRCQILFAFFYFSPKKYLSDLPCVRGSIFYETLQYIDARYKIVFMKMSH